MKKVFLLLLGALLMATLSACDKGYTNIDNDELRTMLQSSDDYQFIDVRTSEEYYNEHIPGFNMIIDYYVLEDDYSILEQFDLDTTKPIVLMCRTGNRSSLAASIFKEEGFTEIYNLKDGIEGWDGETE